MVEPQASQTALAVAALRAVHQLIDGDPKLLDDRVILQLLDPATIERIKANPANFKSPQSLGLRANVLIRSRYAEDRLAQAVKQGITQVVSLGAGFDTFPYRQPSWAQSLRLYEVDQPYSQAAKQERLGQQSIRIPANLTFVPVDFETTALIDGLCAGGFDPLQPTFISWLGVTMYLTRPSIEAVLKTVVALPRGSELVFTFAPPESPEHNAARSVPSLAELASRHGEPWKTYIAPDDLIAWLQLLGFSAVTLPTPAEIDRWYIRGRQDGLQTLRRRTIASAVV